MPALVLEEFGQGMYGLRERRFAAGDVVIDVGAHIGAVSIILAKLNPAARVIAYEPASSNYADSSRTSRPITSRTWRRCRKRSPASAGRWS